MKDAFDTLPPWLAAEWFQLGQAKVLTLVLSTALPLAIPDPMRVAIGFGSQGSSSVFVATDQKTVSTAPNGAGWALTTSSPNVMFLFRDWGPFVQGEWWAFGASGGPIVVWELRLRDWPQPLSRRERRARQHSPQRGFGDGRAPGYAAAWPQQSPDSAGDR